MPLAMLQTAETIEAVTQAVQSIPGGVLGFFGLLLFLIVIMPYVVSFVHTWQTSKAIGGGLTEIAKAVGSLKDTQGSHHNENTEKLTRIEDGVSSTGRQLDTVLTKQETHGALLQRIDAGRR